MDYKEVELTQGLRALVSPEDYEMVSQHKWYAAKDGKRWYARRSYRENGKKKSMLMHRMIMGFPEVFVDHADGNGLNNVRTNLRLATNKQNQANSDRQYNNTSGFKGVSWEKSANSWRSMIRISGVQKRLGNFTDKEEAARAYDRAAIEHHGEFARLNFPEVRDLDS